MTEWSGHTYWAVCLGLGFGAALIVAILLAMLLRAVWSIERVWRS